jgi:hypothetical protein
MTYLDTPLKWEDQASAQNELDSRDWAILAVIAAGVFAAAWAAGQRWRR